MSESPYAYNPNFWPDPKFPYLWSFLKWRGKSLTFEKFQDLKRRLSLFNISIENQLWALKEDIEYYFAGDMTLMELISNYAQIQGLGYSWNRYGFFDQDDEDPTLTNEQEIRLQYAKARIWNIIVEEHASSQKRDPKTQQAIDMSQFFTTEFCKLSDAYPDSYPKDDRKLYNDYHHPVELIEKMRDPTRFFRIVRDDETGEILAYFESKQSTQYNDTQVVQWIFVSEEARQQWLARYIWQEFEKWCRLNGYKSIWSFVALRNTISQQVHETLMPNGMRWLHDSHGFIYVQSVSELRVTN